MARDHSCYDGRTKAPVSSEVSVRGAVPAASVVPAASIEANVGTTIGPNSVVPPALTGFVMGNVAVDNIILRRTSI